MRLKNILLITPFFLLNLFVNKISLADNHNIYETLELIQKDIKTLEKAVYSGSIEINNDTLGSSNLDNNSEDVLTRHLLKLSEIENQFQQLTNKFEEINFKLDKLSNRLSKVQADNQIRFQDIETALVSDEGIDKVSKKMTEDNVLPGSSTPQDLGSISYKDTTSNEVTQKIESVETTATVVTETFLPSWSTARTALPIDQCFGPLALRTRTLPNRRSRFAPLGVWLHPAIPTSTNWERPRLRGWMEPEARRYPLAP